MAWDRFMLFKIIIIIKHSHALPHAHHLIGLIQCNQTNLISIINWTTKIENNLLQSTPSSIKNWWNYKVINVFLNYIFSMSILVVACVKILSQIYIWDFIKSFCFYIRRGSYRHIVNDKSETLLRYRDACDCGVCHLVGII